MAGQLSSAQEAALEADFWEQVEPPAPAAAEAERAKATAAALLEVAREVAVAALPPAKEPAAALAEFCPGPLPRRFSGRGVSHSESTSVWRVCMGAQGA